MAVTFKQVIAPWSGTSPAASGSFTPNGAGDSLFLVGLGSGNLSWTASSGSTPNTLQSLAPQPGQFLQQNGAAGGGTAACGGKNSTASGSQTVTLTAVGGGTVYGWGIDYYGAANIGANYYTTSASPPGTGTGAIQGVPVVVPTGALLVAFCIDGTGDGSVQPTVANGGTSRGSGNASGYAWCVGEWTGTGAAITPEFTSSVGASDYFGVSQVIIAPAGIVLPYQCVSVPTDTGGYPQTITFPLPISVNDVIAVVLPLSDSANNPLPLVIYDSVNTSAKPYATCGTPYWNSTTLIGGAIYYLQSTASGTPAVTIMSATGDQLQGSAIHFVGFAGTATPDTSATAYFHVDTNNSAAVSGSTSTHFNNEIIFAVEWTSGAGGDVTTQISPWNNMPPSSGNEWQSPWWQNTYTNPGTLSLATTINAAGNWVLYFGGLYDNSGGGGGIEIAWVT